MKRLIVSFFLISKVFSLEQSDQLAIQDIILNYTNAWNLGKGVGFGKDFSKDASFVNIFAMRFVGKSEIEDRHIKILETFLRDSTLEIINISLQEVKNDVVIAIVEWKVDNFRSLESNEGEVRRGMFTQVFVKNEEKWEIVASHNSISKV